MADTRRKDTNWKIRTNADGTVPAPDAHLAVLMDIRDEMKKLNGLLHCQNFVAIPAILRQIVRKLPPRKPARKKPHGR